MKLQILGLALALGFSAATNAEGVRYRFSSDEAYQEVTLDNITVSKRPLIPEVLSLYINTKNGLAPEVCAVPFTGWMKETFGDSQSFVEAVQQNKYLGKIAITQHTVSQVAIGWAHGTANGKYGIGTCGVNYQVAATDGTEVQYRFSKSEAFQKAAVHAVEVENLGPMTVMHTFVKLQNGVVTKSCASTSGFEAWMAKSFEDPMGMADMLATNGIGGKLVVTQYSHGQYSVSDIHPAVNGTYGAGTCNQHYEAAASK